MSKQRAPLPLQLEKDEIWQKANEITQRVYGQLHDFPEEEKWVTQVKLRAGANDLLWSVAQGVSGAVPAGLEYDWGQARKQAGTLKTMYRFATRQKFIELQPEIMVMLNELIRNIDTKVAEAYVQTQEHNERELELWRERYRLWKQANEKAEETL